MTTQELPADGRALPDCREMSAAVRAAQERLLELRRIHGVEARGRAASGKWQVAEKSPVPPCSSAPLLPCSPASPLGRHSENLTRHLRATAKRREKVARSTDSSWLERLRATAEVTSYELRVTSEEGAPLLPCPPASTTACATFPPALIRVYPDIALGILRRKKAAPGRVWLLLRHADAAGRGWVSTAEAARLLTGAGSPLRICGRRQLANLLAAGDGLFWERNTGRDGREQLWLRSAARAAAGLGVERLGGSPVAVPLAALTGTIGQARAHLYASFHSGRQRADLLTGRPRPRGPIARSTLCKLSGATFNSQRNYERRAVIGRKSAIAVGPALHAADEHEVAWRRGHALFHLRDEAGRFGRPGAVYLAWRLPNEYIGPHATLPRGRQKRLNRALADLFHDGMTGNDERTGRSGQWAVVSRSVGQWVSGSVVGGQESAGQWSVVCARRFYGSAKAAALSRGGGEKYWRYGEQWLWQPGELGIRN